MIHYHSRKRSTREVWYKVPCHLPEIGRQVYCHNKYVLAHHDRSFHDRFWLFMWWCYSTVSHPTSGPLPYENPVLDQKSQSTLDYAKKDILDRFLPEMASLRWPCRNTQQPSNQIASSSFASSSRLSTSVPMPQSQYISHGQAQGGSSAGYFDNGGVPTYYGTYAPTASPYSPDKPKKLKKFGKARR